MAGEQKAPESQPIPPPPPPRAKEPEPVDAVPAAPTAQQFKEAEKRMTAFERSTVRWTRVAVFASILAAIFICLQWIVMDSTLNEMKRSGDNATNQLWQAIGNMNWMARTADGSLHQAQQIFEANKLQTKRLADSTEKAAEAAKSGTETNRNALVLENRPWLGVTEETVTQLEAGKEIKAQITLFNSGKTPASQVIEAASVAALPSIPTVPILFGLKPTAAIPPQASHILRFTSHAKLSGIEMGKITDKSILLVFRGVIQYEDFNRVQRHTNVCMFMSDPATKQLTFCENGNDMD